MISATSTLLIIIFASFASFGLADSLLGTGWIVMRGELAVPVHYAGFISMTVALCSTAASLGSVRVVRRLGTGMMLALSVTFTAAALLLFSFSNNFIFLILAAIPLGLGNGSIDAGLNNYVALHYDARRMSWLHCCWGLGASCSPLIMSAYLSRGQSWRFGYRTVGGIQAALALCLFATLFLWKRCDAARAANVTTQGGDTGGKHPSFGALLKVAGVKSALFTFVCYCSCESIAGLWSASYLTLIRGAAPELAARWVSLFYAGIMAGRFFGGILTARLNNKQMVRLCQGIITCGVIMLALPLPAQLNNIFMPLTMLLIGLGCGPIFPSLIKATPANFGAENSQAIIGMQMASSYASVMLMPPLFGRLASLTSFAFFPAVLALFLLLQFLLVGRLFRRAGTCKES
jgi:fucose permease